MATPNPQAFELTAEEYEQLRAVAHGVFRRYGHDHHSIQPTVVLHEAWAKLANSSSRFESREHFMATAARAMRQTLISRARARASLRRGQDPIRTTLAGIGAADRGLDVLELDEALTALSEVDPDAAKVVLLHTFGGLTIAEIAETLSTSKRTIDRRWRFAKVYLAKALG